MNDGYFDFDQLVKFNGKNALIENAITKDGKPYYLIRMSDGVVVDTDGFETEFFGCNFDVAYGDELEVVGLER